MFPRGKSRGRLMTWTSFSPVATGYVGSAVFRQLVQAGHSVSGLARSDEAAAKVTAAGGTPVRGDISDTGLLAASAEAADAVIHLASPGDATSADSTRAR